MTWPKMTRKRLVLGIRAGVAVGIGFSSAFLTGQPSAVISAARTWMRRTDSRDAMPIKRCARLNCSRVGRSANPFMLRKPSFDFDFDPDPDPDPDSPDPGLDLSVCTR